MNPNQSDTSAVLTFASQIFEPKSIAAQMGRAKFGVCAACHGIGGTGNQAIGDFAGGALTAYKNRREQPTLPARRSVWGAP